MSLGSPLTNEWSLFGKMLLLTVDDISLRSSGGREISSGWKKAMQIVE